MIYDTKREQSLEAEKLRFLNLRLKSLGISRKEDIPKAVAAQKIELDNAAVRLERNENNLGHLNKPFEKKEIKTFKHLNPKESNDPYIEFKVGIQDVVVKSSYGRKTHKTLPGNSPQRGKIKELTRKAISRMKLHFRNAPDGVHKAILTLTYPLDFPTDGVKVKRDLDVMRKWLVRHGVSGGSWFLEFQARGAPHFHCYLNNWPNTGLKGLAKAWFKIVGSTDKKHYLWHLGKLSGRPCLEWLRVPHAASAYATKYATKQEQKKVPADFQSVGRFWGCWGKVRPVWRFHFGHGFDNVNRGKAAVLHFRARFSSPDQLRDFDNRPFPSCVMWGGSADLYDLLGAVDWTPFDNGLWTPF